MVNFLDETILQLNHAGKSSDDVVYIGSTDTGHRCTWLEFEELANFDYDNSYGSSKIATDLVIIFSDGSWFERGEYDGSEWWEYKTCPSIPTNDPLPINRLGADDAHWPSLHDLNSTEEED